MTAATLIERMQGRDNNLNLLRMLAASMVLVSHSFVLSTGWPHGYEPWRATYGTTPGAVAVEIFFVVSGMLLTYSLLQRRSTWGFVRARALRIYPGLIVAVALTVFVLGPIVTTLDVASYLTERQTWSHLVRRWLAVPFVIDALPGVFDDNPAPKAVNGSLWTLRYELFAYAILLAAWIVSALVARVQLFKAACLAIFAVCLAMRLRKLGQEPLEHDVQRLFFAFFTGAAMCILGHRIRLHPALFAAAVAAVVVGAIVPAVFAWAYTFAMPFIVAWLAYVPSGAVRAYNRVGDYSYGTYIYAFPLQQMLVWAVPGIAPVPLMIGSMLATLAFAIASWHLVEKPASQWRGFGRGAGKEAARALRA
jgi:peptidoglycan/LPS O-acetylase OafA/YrhL